MLLKDVKLPLVEAQGDRRFLGAHFRIDAPVLSPNAKYAYIGWGGRDVVRSLYSRHALVNEWWRGVERHTRKGGKVGSAIGKLPELIIQYFNEWLGGDAYPFCSLWKSVRSSWPFAICPTRTRSTSQCRRLRRTCGVLPDFEKVWRYEDRDVAEMGDVDISWLAGDEVTDATNWIYTNQST